METHLKHKDALFWGMFGPYVYVSYSLTERWIPIFGEWTYETAKFYVQREEEK